jgi:hypothetical protein
MSLPKNHTKKSLTQILLQRRSWKGPFRGSLSHKRDRSKNLHFHRLSEFFQKSLRIFGIDTHRWAWGVSFLSKGKIDIKSNSRFKWLEPKKEINPIFKSLALIPVID